MKWIKTEDELPPWDEFVFIWHPVHGFDHECYLSSPDRTSNYTTEVAESIRIMKKYVTHWSKPEKPNVD